jgi:hypothetical protein
LADNVIRPEFIKATPPAAHPALMAASDYGMACMVMAASTYGTREYDEALTECNRQWELIAAALGVDSVDGRKG